MGVPWGSNPRFALLFQFSHRNTAQNFKDFEQWQHNAAAVQHKDITLDCKDFQIITLNYIYAFDRLFNLK